MIDLSSTSIIPHHKWPKYYKWPGDRIFPKDDWSFGWLTGPDRDLVCIKPNIKTNDFARVALSPICSNRFLATVAFCTKRFLAKLDQNITDFETLEQKIRKGQL